MKRILLATATASVFFLMVLGGLVSATDSGLGCGDDWPKCNGQWIPSFDTPEVFLEWLHRLVAALTGLLVLGAVLVARRQSTALAAAALGLLIVQVILGAIAVRLELPPAVSTAHLAVGTALFAVLIALFVVSSAPSSPSPAPAAASAPGSLPVGLLGAAVAVTFLQMVLGAYVRHIGAGLACPDPIVCFPSQYLPVTVHFLHRLMALGVLGLVHAAGARLLRRGGGLRWAGGIAMVLVVVQIGLGVLSVSTQLQPHVTTTHLAVALLLLGTLVYAYTQGALRGRPQPQPQPAPLRAEA